MQRIIDTRQTIKRRIEGKGNKEGKIAFVGEYPIGQDIKAGEPLSGLSGELLNSLMHTTGIVRSNCYITQVIKEEVRKGSLKEIINIKKRIPIESDKFKRYMEELKKELEGTKANVIVAVGEIALWALTGMKSVTKRRGSIYESSLLVGRKVIPIIHPLTAIRQYNFRHFIVYDLRRIKNESEFPEVIRREKNMIIQPSYMDVMEFLAKCSGVSMVAFDIEVSNEEVSCISFAYNDKNVISIPFLRGGQDYFNPNQEVSIWKAISYILENREIIKLAQNGVFDSTFLLRKYGINVRPIDDTMVAQAILIPDFPKGLDFITSIYTNNPYYKDEGKFRIKSGSGSDRDFWMYNAKDSIVLMEAFPRMLEELRGMKNMETYRRQVKMVEPLVYISERGIRMDVKGLRDESRRVGKELEFCEEELNKMTKGEINNPRSPKQVADYFYIRKSIKPYVNRSTGRPTTNDVALKRIARKGFKEAEILQKIRGMGKMKSTYLDMNLDKDGRIRCNMNPVGAADSGRLSSSKTIFGTGANMQNQPWEMKKYMLADEGYIMYNIDLSQADNRCVAYVAPEFEMIQAFETGVDVHTKTASLIFKKSLDEISNKSGSSVIGDGRHSERFWGKKANHSLNYGEGYKRFALDNEIPENDAKEIVESYHSVYPGIRQYHSWIENQLRVNGRVLENPYGRRRTFMSRWGHDLFKEAYSWIPQSTVADKMNKDGILFVYYNQQWFHDVEILNQVHDSLVFQIPISIGWEKHADIILKIKRSLESSISWRIQTFNIPTDIDVGLNLGKMGGISGWKNNPSLIDVSKELERIYEECLEM